MNHNNFMKWVETQLIPNLPPQSVLVVDNASYHNVCAEENITSGSLKNKMKTWLRDRDIEYNENWTKPELFEKILLYKSQFPRKPNLDKVLERHGHKVLRLPPYHPELNPIEKIWALAKNWVASRNVTFKLGDVEKLTREKFNEIGVNEWKKVCEHVIKHEKRLIESENLLDDTVDNLSFTVNTGTSDEESSSLDDDDDDDIRPLSDSD